MNIIKPEHVIIAVAVAALAALAEKDQFITVMLAGTLEGELRDRVHVLEAALAKTEERRSHYEDLAAERGRSLDQDERELCDLRARLAAAEGAENG